VLGRRRCLRRTGAGLGFVQAYFKQVRRKVTQAGWSDRFEYRGEVDREGKLALLREAQAFCVPSRFAEARGVAVMEALASGLPVVVPNTGVYPEMLEGSEAGLTVAPGDIEATANALRALVASPAEAARRGQLSATLIASRYSADAAAEEMLAAIGLAAERRLRSAADG